MKLLAGCLTVLLLLGSLPPQRADAQTRDTAAAGGWLRAMPLIGDVADDRLRADQVLGQAPTAGYLLRATSSLAAPLGGPDGRFRWQLLAPVLEATWNSEIPFSGNDGALWAGRGAGVRVTGGARAALGRVELTLAPELTYAENRDFQGRRYPLYPFLPRMTGRSTFANLWYTTPESIDLPFRFGSLPFATLSPGQSSLRVTAGPVRVALATDDEWWGPGIRNAIVMSDNAPGIPRLTVATRGPLRTAIGQVEGRWTLGALRESQYFDAHRQNDHRSLSGLALTLAPTGEPNLTLGISRTVYAPVLSFGEIPRHAADVLLRWDRRTNARDTAYIAQTEQLTSLFGRWVFPSDGAEIYAEWARQELPMSLRDLLLNPHHSQGYTVGAQWLRPVRSSRVRLQAEATNLEMSATFRHRQIQTFYASRGVPQGYTHRGQVIGAWIGPGSSSQWAAADLLAPGWQVGLFGERIRWNTAALYPTEPVDPFRGGRSFHANDVSLVTGLRAGGRVAGVWLGGEVAHEYRFNYLFQNPDTGFDPEGAIDVRNFTVRLSVVPFAR